MFYFRDQKHWHIPYNPAVSFPVYNPPQHDFSNILAGMRKVSAWGDVSAFVSLTGTCD